MKKKLLAILLSASMVVCLMPTMAFATEEPATTEEATPEVENVVEEPKEEVQEETPAVTEEEEVAEEVVEEAKEETAAEVKEEVTEEVKETAEEVATTQSVEETAELTDVAFKGHWEGYKFIVESGDAKNIGIICKSGDAAKINGNTLDFSNEEDYVLKNGKIENNVVDFTEVVSGLFANGYESCMAMVAQQDEDKQDEIVIDGDTTLEYGASFYNLKTTINVEKTAIKDTTFTYDLDSQIKLNFEGLLADNSTFIKVNPTADSYEWLDGSNNVILKKGEKSVSDSMVLRVNEMNMVEYLSWEFYEEKANVEQADPMYCTVMNVLKMVSNDGGYDVDSSKWVFTPQGMFELADYFVAGDISSIDPTKLKYVDLGIFGDDVDAFVKALNDKYESDEDDDALVAVLSYIKDLTNADQMSFYCTGGDVAEVTTSDNTGVKKGVQTGDSNELGLWLAFGMLASVAAAGYALKRREI